MLSSIWGSVEGGAGEFSAGLLLNIGMPTLNKWETRFPKGLKEKIF